MYFENTHTNIKPMGSKLKFLRVKERTATSVKDRKIKF